ncbi:hypothetical protein C4544_04805 [candidate division WS5 bacterium]|uniref:Glycosyltransferase RgtA/B/C/D-like domain-containing protein n=1 Tax=candidate division WS5 bacterium TaxID=2093353 RepID=A0A419DC20_9BACT|nr:MAG: hypothetical protein C4544_04805 [candidate division WS5 bacterium]
MPQSILNWLAKFTKYSLLLLGVSYILKYLFVVYSRIDYPFELEWMEGGVLAEVRRILSGQKLYVKPSIEYIPFLYTPFYFYVSALVSSIAGIGFESLRLVSFISSLGCFYIVFMMTYKETRSKYAGLLAICLFAASYPLTGTWFDIGRVDTLFMFLLLSAVYFVRFGASDKMYFLAGILMALSFLTKQTALLISFPIMLYSIIWNWRRSIIFISTAVILGSGMSVFLNFIYDGWYNYYVFGIADAPLFNKMFIHFWKNDLFLPMPIALIMSLFYLLGLLFKENKNSFIFYVLLFAGMAGGACLSRMNPGGGQNVLIPAYAVISILFGMAFHGFFEHIKILSEGKRYLLTSLICIICILQFGSPYIRYGLHTYIPKQKDLEAGMKLVETIKHVKGDVFMPDFGYLAVMAGKNSYAHGGAIRDILMLTKGENRDNLFNQINTAIEEIRFKAIIISSNNGVEDRGPGLRNVRKYYVRQAAAVEGQDVFWPIIGLAIRPEFVYVPQKQL